MHISASRRYNRFGRHLAALVCGAMMPFAFSPHDQLWLGLLGLGGWAWLLRRGSGFVNGLFFGFGWFGLGGWWLADTFHVYGHLPYAAALPAVALAGAVLGLFPALWGWGVASLRRQEADVVLLFPMLAMAEEWLRGHVFTGLPWTALGNLILDTPAVGWGSIIGVYGSSLIPSLIAAGCALLFVASARKAALGALASAAVIVLAAPSLDAGSGPLRRVALIQPNIAQNQKWDAAFLQETMARLALLSDRAMQQQPDLIIWPEAAVPFFLEDAPQWEAWLNTRVNAWNRPLLFGGLKRVDAMRSIENGLFLQLPGVKKRSFAGKHHLVPFGEYVPSWLPWLHKLVPDIGDFHAATDSGILIAGNEHYGALICYESIFPDEARARVAAGATVLVVVTNDAWYGTSPAAWQHLQAARMRAVETGRFVLRAANTGVSAIIAPDGSLTAGIPWWTEGVVHGTYRALQRQTFYQQWGDKILLILIAMPAFLLLWLRRRT